MQLRSIHKIVASYSQMVNPEAAIRGHTSPLSIQSRLRSVFRSTNVEYRKNIGIIQGSYG